MKHEMLRYKTGTVTISFPPEQVCCRLCPLLRADYKLNREYCARTGELMLFVDDTVGRLCPMIWEEDNG